MDNGWTGGQFTMLPNSVNEDGLSVYAARLYWELMSHENHDRDGEYLAFPNYETLSKKLRMSEDKITDAINELVRKGWIRDITKGGKIGDIEVSPLQNVYHLNIQKNVNYDLVKKREENTKRNRKKTLFANARKATRQYENKETNPNDVACDSINKVEEDTSIRQTQVNESIVTLPQPTNENDPTITAPQPTNSTAEEGYNHTKTTILNSIPVSNDTGKEKKDYPETLWLISLLWGEGYLKTRPPKSDSNLKEYKKWQAQLKKLLKLGTSKEIVQALREGIFYGGLQVHEPAQITKSLKRKLEDIRREEAEWEEGLRNFVKETPYVEEEKDIISYEEAVKRWAKKPDNYPTEQLKKFKNGWCNIFSVNS